MRISRPFQWGALLAIGLVLLGLTAMLLLAEFRMAPELENPATAARGSSTTVAGAGAATPSTAAPTATRPSTPEKPAPTATAVELSPTPPLVPSATLAPTTALTVSLAAPGWERIRIEDTGIALDAPAAWTRAGADWIWKPDPAEPLRVGLSWQAISDPAWEPAAMLPAEAELLSVTPVNLGWASGQSFRVKIQSGDRLLAVEQHTVVTVNDEIAYDFFASAPTLSGLALLEPIWQQMTGSVTLEVSSGGPIDVTVRFLAAVARGDPVDNYLTARQQGRAPLEVLNLPGLYSHFSVSWEGDQEGRVLLQATFTYADREIGRTLILVWQDEHWRVDGIQ